MKNLVYIQFVVMQVSSSPSLCFLSIYAPLLSLYILLVLFPFLYHSSPPLSIHPAVCLVGNTNPALVRGKARKPEAVSEFEEKSSFIYLQCPDWCPCQYLYENIQPPSVDKGCFPGFPASGLSSASVSQYCFVSRFYPTGYSRRTSEKKNNLTRLVLFLRVFIPACALLCRSCEMLQCQEFSERSENRSLFSRLLFKRRWRVIHCGCSA